MKTYMLHITRNGQTEAVLLQEGHTAAIEAQDAAAFHLTDAEGRPAEQPLMEQVGSDLHIYAGNVRTGSPDLVLKNYSRSFPVQNTPYPTPADTAAPAAEAAVLAEAAPVAEPITAAGMESGAGRWVAGGFAASGLAAAGLAGRRKSSSGKQAASDVSANPQMPEAQPAVPPVAQEQKVGAEEAPAAEEAAKPVEEIPAVVEAEKLVAETTVAVEPAKPVEETPVAVEPAKPVEETTAVVEQAKPVEETPVVEVPEKPAEEAPVVVEPAKPVAETTVAVEAVKPVVETPVAVELVKPVGEAPAVVESLKPVAETTVAVEPVNPAEETPAVVESVNPVAEAPVAVEPAKPVEETTVAAEQAKPVEEIPVVEVPVKPVAETTVAVEPAKPVEETTAVVEQAKPAEEAPVVVVAEKPVVETPVAKTTVAVEPAKPVEETTVAAEQTKPVVETPAVVEPVNPVAETPVVVEPVKPVEEATVVVEQTKPVEEIPVVEVPAKPVEETTVVAEQAKPVEEIPIVEAPVKPVVETSAVVESAKPVEEATVAVEPVKPVEETAVVEQTKPVEETPVVEVPAKPVEETTVVAEQAKPVEEIPIVEAPVKPVVETSAVVESAKPVEEATVAAEQTKPVEETPVVVEAEKPVVETPAVVEPVKPVEETAVVEQTKPVEEIPVVEAPVKPAEETPAIEEPKKPAEEIPTVTKPKEPVDLSLTVEHVAGDNIINQTEKNHALTLSGRLKHSSDVVQAKVYAAVNGRKYAADVSDGLWSVTLDGSALPETQGRHIVSVSAEAWDSSGILHTAQAERMFTVDTAIERPEIIFDKIAGDDIINAAESQRPLTVSGRVENARENDTVNVNVGGRAYQTNIKNNAFSVEIGGGVLAASERLTAEVRTEDEAGNRAETVAEKTYRVDTAIERPEITFDKIAEDDIINAAESQRPLTVSGRVENARENDTVNVNVGGRAYQTNIKNNAFSVEIGGGVLAASERLTAEVRTEDEAGNRAEAVAEKTYRVDTAIERPEIIFDKIAGDDIINLVESQTKTTVVSGKVLHAAENDEIVLNVGDAVYRGRLAGGAFEVAVDTKTLLNHGKVSASLTTADEAQNTATATAERSYRIDTEYRPAISLDKIAGDNVLNIAESENKVRVTGTVSDVADGEEVLVSCGCESCGSVRWIEMLAKVRDGAFEVEFSGADMKGSTYNLVKAKVTSSDDAGNTATAEARQSYTKDLEAPQVGVSVNDVAGDNILSRAERQQPDQTVSGSVSGLKEDERVTDVEVRVNGAAYRAQTDGAQYSVRVPTAQLAAAGEVHVRAVVEDAAGNRTVAEGSRSYHNRTPSPLIELNPVASDGFVNKAEADSNSITLSGRVQNVADGTTVYLNAGTQQAVAEVSDGLFSVNVEKTFFGITANTKNAAGTLTASVTAGDEGNETVSVSLPYRIDLVNETTISIDNVDTDNLLDEHNLEQTHLTVSGKVTDGRAGETVTVQINKIEYTALVQENGTYSVNAETARILAAKAEGKYPVTATVKRVDAAGNEGEGNVTFGRVFRVDKTAPVGVIVFDPVAGDNNLNSQDLVATHVGITGRVTQIGEGDEVRAVTVSVGGNAYTAVVTGTVFKASVPVEVIKAHTFVRAEGTVRDALGREAAAIGAKQDYTQHAAAPSVEVRIDSINGGKAVHAAQLSESVTLAGSVVKGASVAAESVAVSVSVNGQTYTPVLSGNSWTLAVPAAVLAFAEGRLNISASVSAADRYGNTASHTAQGSYSVDTAAPAPVIRIDNIAADNIIDPREKSGRLTVSGKVEGAFKAGDTVVLEMAGSRQEVRVNGSGAFSTTVAGSRLADAAVSAVKASVSTTDDAGNRGSAQTVRGYTVKNGNLEITLDGIASDGLINVTEAGQKITLSGRVSGADAAPRQTVELLVGGETLRAEVRSDYRFSVQVDAAKLTADTDYTVQASVSGRNGASAKTARTYTVAPEAAAKVEITAIDGDFHVDMTHLDGNTRINGRIELNEGVFTEGLNGERLRRITVNIGEQTYQAGIKPDRSFFLDIPTKELAALNGKALSFKIDSDPVLYDLVQTGENAYRVNQLARNSKVDVKAITFDSPLLVKNQEGVYTVENAAEKSITVSGRAGGTAKEGDIVLLEAGGRVYQAELDRNLTFRADVAAQDIASDADRAVRAVLHTQDLSGRSITVADTERYTVQNAVDGNFVSPHGKAPSAINSDHTSAGYNFPYFIQYAGNVNGGSFRIPFGGSTNGPAVVKYHFMTLDEIAKLPDNYNRFIDKGSTTTYPHMMQELVRKAYKEVSSVTNIEFVEVATAAEANTNYYMGNMLEPFVGASAFAYNGGAVAWNNRYNYPAWGESNLSYTILHEISHTLGMAHTSIGFKDSYRPEDSGEFSHMSYNRNTNNKLFIDDLRQLGVYDLAYLHYAFGPNKTVRAGNDTYTFKNYNMFTRDTDRYIWDGGGVDTFDASHETKGVHVNLTPGSWIYTGSVLEKNFSVKSSSVYDMRAYFGLDGSAKLSNGNVSAATTVTLNHYTEGQAFIGYGTQIENLKGSAHDDVLTGNNAANNIYGGAGSDTVSGGAGNDYLDGGTGADTLSGGEGNDTYVVDHTGDTVTEAAGQGEDHVYSSVDYALGANLEHLTLLGVTAIKGSGNALDNTLTGNGLDNILSGGAGNDRIIGGAGSDTLIGGAGRDTFVFDHILDGSVDTVSGFTVGQDILELDSSVFESLSSGMADWERYVHYQADSGRLYYDRDGSGSADAVHFATLDKDLQISQNSFTVV